MKIWKYENIFIYHVQNGIYKKVKKDKIVRILMILKNLKFYYFQIYIIILKHFICIFHQFFEDF